LGERIFALQQLCKQNWLQFLFVVKATALKVQISKFYPHRSTEASYNIYTSQWPVMYLKLNFCPYNVRIKEGTSLRGNMDHQNWSAGRGAA